MQSLTIQFTDHTHEAVCQFSSFFNLSDNDPGTGAETSQLNERILLTSDFQTSFQ